jgi:hypothetical protein
MRRLDDGRFVVIRAWLYTWKDIECELLIDGVLSENHCLQLDQKWPASPWSTTLRH